MEKMLLQQEAFMNKIVETIQSTLTKRFDAVEHDIFVLHEENKKKDETISSLQEEILKLRREINATHNKMDDIVGDLDSLEQDKLAEGIIIRGMDVQVPVTLTYQEDLKKAVCTKLSQHGIKVEPSEIKTARKFKGEPKSPIELKVTSQQRQQEILRNRKQLKGSRIFLCEQITPLRQKVLNTLLDKKKQGKLKNCWTSRGQIYYADVNNVVVKCMNLQVAMNM